MMPPGKPPAAGCSFTMLALIYTFVRTLFLRREAALLDIYATITNVEDTDLPTTRSRFQEPIGTLDSSTQEKLERHLLLFSRLQAAWFVLWMLVLPGILAAYFITKDVESGPWSFLQLMLVMVVQLVILLVTWGLLLVVQGKLLHGFLRLLGRFLTIPGVFEFGNTATLPSGDTD